MRFAIVVWLICAAGVLMLPAHCLARDAKGGVQLYGADDPRIEYVGRFDFSNPKLPRFWAGAAYVTARFEGPSCSVLINDQVEWGKYLNYLEIVVDGSPVRLQTTEATNSIVVAKGLSDGPHTVTICKDTESQIGYLEFAGIECQNLLAQPAEPVHRLEFIGDSITAGSKSDESQKPCGVGDWYEQDNAYMAYGPRTARALNAQWHVSAVSGIGLIHSCCGMTITMPDVYETTNLQAKGEPWDFSKYQPDAVTVCLGQNDGGQDPSAFVARYVQFIGTLRALYPGAQIVCLTSPMADPGLTAVLKQDITQVVAQCNAGGDKNVHSYFFSRSYNDGCGGHPDVAEHALIAKELTAYLKTLMGW